MKKIEFESVCRRYHPETLCTGSIFGALSADATAFLLKNGNIHEVLAGENVFQYGDPGNSFFVVCEGELAFYKHYGEHVFMTRRVEFGEEVGFVAMIALHDHAGHAVALKDSIVLEIRCQLFSELHQRFPLDFGLMLMNLARDLARIVRKLSDIVVEAKISNSGDDGQTQ